MSFEVRFDDGSVEQVDGADTYQLEGPMTTFFKTRDGRPVVDSWAERVASFRTTTVLAVLRGQHVAPVRIATPLAQTA